MLSEALFCMNEKERKQALTVRMRRDSMSGLQLGSNFAVFALFFGLSLLEAFQAGNWLRAAFWLAIATVFLYSDRKQRQEHL